MSDEIVKENEEVKVEEKVDIMKLLDEKINSLKAETSNEINSLKDLLKQKDEELAEFKKIAESKQEQDNDLKKVMDNRKSIEEQRKAQAEKERLELLEKENNMLKLQTKVTEFIKKHPYLEDVLSEKIAEGKITSYEQLETEFTPSEIKKFKELEDYKKLIQENFGKDPLGQYSVNSEAKAKFADEKAREEARNSITSMLHI